MEGGREGSASLHPFPPKPKPNNVDQRRLKGTTHAGSQVTLRCWQNFHDHSTEIGYKVYPKVTKLCESCLLAPSGRGERVHAT